MEAIARQLPFPNLGIDSGNNGALIKETLVRCGAQRGIEFTRSRAYLKNDQAWIKQKNGSVVRRFTGHDRFSGRIAGQTMVHLCQGESVRELLPAVVQTPRKVARRSQNHQALHPAGHTLRPADP